jgi:hypothetical protein
MKISAYTAFTSLSYRVINIVGAVVFLLIGFLLKYYIGDIGTVILSCMMPIALSFADFFAFSGTSARKQRTMNYMKSSLNGAGLFREALKTDLLIKNICILAGFLGYFLATLIGSPDSLEFSDTILVMLIYLPVAQVTLHVTLIISRRIALTLATQTMVCYLCSMISTILLFIYSFMLPEHMTDFTMYIIIMFVILEIVGVVCGILLYRDCKKGYDSSFTDT